MIQTFSLMMKNAKLESQKSKILLLLLFKPLYKPLERLLN